MTNTQAALIAAARLYAGTGKRHDTAEVTDCAEEFLAWLDGREHQTPRIGTEKYRGKP